MIATLLAYALAVGPYILGAFALALALVGLAPWYLQHPERWLLWVIIALSFTPTLGGADADGSVLRQVSWGSLFVIAFAMLLFDRDRSLLSLVKTIPLGMILLLALVFLSIAWSPTPLISLKRSAQLLGVLFLALATVRPPPRARSLQSQLTVPVSTFLGIGLFAALAAPSLAFDGEHAMRAISSHKNSWGQFSLLASLVFLFAMLHSATRRQWILVGLACALFSLVLSRSVTSIMALTAVLGLVVFWRSVVSKNVIGKMLVIASIVAIGLAILAYTVYAGKLPDEAFIKWIYQLSGRSQSLSGRTYLWQLMYDQIGRHPWLGIGYGGFWTGGSGASAAMVSRLNWGPPTQAHSGYIDVVNEIGLLGLALVTWMLLAHAVNIVQLLRAEGGAHASFHGAILLSFLIINYAESSLIRTTHFWWVVLSVSMLEVHAHVRRLAAGNSAGLPQTRSARQLRN